MPYAELEFGLAKNGQPTAKISGINLHSAMDPSREAEKMALSPETETADFVIVFGAGLGYLTRALKEQAAERPVLVIEPERDWFEQAEGKFDSAAFNSPEVAVMRPEHRDDIVLRLQDAGSRNPVFLANPAIQKLRPELFDLCRDAIRVYKERFQVNVNTLRRFGKLWVKNLARNLDFLAKAPGVAQLENCMQGVPGLLVAGGPSLDRYLPSLIELEQRMLVVAVDTSLRACLRAGVDPDFVVTVDPQYWNTRHMDGCFYSKACVVSESSVFPRGLRLSSGTLLLCSSLFPLGQYFEEMIEDKGKLGAGGSVATTAWDFLRFAGCSEIFTLGLDLSFPGLQTHFHGSVFEEASHRECSRRRTSEHIRYDALSGSYTTLADDGTMVLSDRRMDIYVHWFENQMRMHPSVRTARIGSGSRVIEGIANIDLEKILSLPLRRKEIDRIHSRVAELKKERDSRCEKDLKILSRARLSLVEDLREFETLTGQAKSLATLARRQLSSGKGAQSIIEELDRIDSQLLESSQQRVAGFLVEEIIQNLSTAAKPQSLDEALERSEKLYGSIAEVCTYQRKLFEQQ